jgi:hypothetical protein
LDGDKVLAVVERKTFDGLLADFGRMDTLGQRLLDLTPFEQHAVVIEAPYEDFLSPDNVHPWSLALCSTTRRAGLPHGPAPGSRECRSVRGKCRRLLQPSARAAHLPTDSRPPRGLGRNHR